jgi:hypothetical protein
MNYNTKIALGAIGMIAIVLLILWYTGFFKKEKNTAQIDAYAADFAGGVARVGGTDGTSLFSTAATEYNTLRTTGDADLVVGCVKISDSNAAISMITDPNNPGNPCIQRAQNNEFLQATDSAGVVDLIGTDGVAKYPVLLTGNYEVDVTNSFVTSPGNQNTISEIGTYCCQDAASAAAQDVKMIEKFKTRKSAALRMKEAATAGANSLATAATTAANSQRRFTTNVVGYI